MFELNIKSISNSARLMLAGTVIASMMSSCSDTDNVVDGVNHNWEISGNEIVNIKPERYKKLKNPMTGWVLYTGLGDGLRDAFDPKMKR